ncbi:hypothetical protein [Streptomyces sulphureus]|uniref:hypothetical protein n=1 Tax=Streptomyces sulphureus TaxID=47758 RepID=UPI00036C5C41|nr:hypothetical protein [Streptomyces sulphureus]
MPEPNSTAPTDGSATASDDVEPLDEPGGDPPGSDAPLRRLTPRQARRVRILLSAVVMLAVAIALVVRLGSAPSVLTVGFYGIALILSGAAIGLSRRGRTRVATGVLGLGFLLVLGGEWLLRG